MVLLCRHSILALHGLDAYKMPDAACTSTLADILEENSEKYKYTQEVQAHKNKLLCKYLYYHDKGEEEVEKDMDSNVLNSQHELGSSSSSAQNMILEAAKPKVEIKYEKEGQKTLKELILVSETCKKTMQPLYNVAQDLVYKVTYTDLKNEVSKVVECVGKFLEELRVFGANDTLLYSFTDDRLAELCLQGEKLKIQGIAHQDCMKLKIKQMRASISK